MLISICCFYYTPKVDKMKHRQCNIKVFLPKLISFSYDINKENKLTEKPGFLVNSWVGTSQRG